MSGVGRPTLLETLPLNLLGEVCEHPAPSSGSMDKNTPCVHYPWRSRRLHSAAAPIQYRTLQADLRLNEDKLMRHFRSVSATFQAGDYARKVRRLVFVRDDVALHEPTWPPEAWPADRTRDAFPPAAHGVVVAGRGR